MQLHFPWLSQGDFFTDVPMPSVDVQVLLEVPVGTTYSSTRGPALLITYDCVIDKPQTSRFQLVPVRELSDQSQDTITMLRRGDLNPAEAIYLELGGGQEGVALLSESYVIPTEYFVTERRDFSGHPAIDENDPYRVQATQNDTRGLSMTDTERHQMRKKMVFYWTRHTID